MPTSTVNQRSYSRHLSLTNMSNSAHQQSAYSVANPLSTPPPPTDLSTYSRTMHQHTKQQMEAASIPTGGSRRSGSGGSSGGRHQHHHHNNRGQQNGISAS